MQIVAAGKRGHAQKWKIVRRSEQGEYGKVVPITAFSETDLLPGFAVG